MTATIIVHSIHNSGFTYGINSGRDFHRGHLLSHLTVLIPGLNWVVFSKRGVLVSIKVVEIRSDVCMRCFYQDFSFPLPWITFQEWILNRTNCFLFSGQFRWLLLPCTKLPLQMSLSDLLAKINTWLRKYNLFLFLFWLLIFDHNQEKIFCLP